MGDRLMWSKMISFFFQEGKNKIVTLKKNNDKKTEKKKFSH